MTEEAKRIRESAKKQMPEPDLRVQVSQNESRLLTEVENERLNAGIQASQRKENG